MPKVNGKEFSYSPAGMAAAAAYRKIVGAKTKPSQKDDFDEDDFMNRPQPRITKAEVLRHLPPPEAGETQGSFVKGQLGTLDEGERGVLNNTNTAIARKFLIEFYRNWRAKQIGAARGKKVR